MHTTYFAHAPHPISMLTMSLKFSAKVAAGKIIDNSTFHEIIIRHFIRMSFYLDIKKGFLMCVRNPFFGIR